MSFRKILLVLLVPVVAEVVMIACSNCDDHVLAFYSNKSFSVDHLDNSGELPVVADSARVSRQAYGLRVTMLADVIVQENRSPASFFQSAFAQDYYCDDVGHFEGIDAMADFQIISLTDFDGDHPAGADVSDYFKAYTADSRSFQAIDAYFSSDVSEWMYSSTEELVRTADLLLMTAPTRAGIYQFNIRLPLSDGRLLEQTTTPITLTE